MWGGSDMPAHDWCGVKVQNPEASNASVRQRQGVINGRLYGFAVFQGMDEGKKLVPERQMNGLWVCENHDEAFKALHEDWAHTLVTFATPLGNVYTVVPEEIERMFEVSFRFFTDNEGVTNTEVSETMGRLIKGNMHKGERHEYLKVIG